VVELPLVTIITPSYNQGEFLEQAIQSVLDQDYPHIEYIIIDGGSMDGSFEILRRYSDRLAYWESKPDRGQAQAINKGLKRATGSILSWLNSDDVLCQETVGRAVDVFVQHPEIDVVYGHIERIDEQGRLIPTPILPKDRVTFDKHLAIGESLVNQPGAFWQRTIMEKSGLLDENLSYAIDYEYWLRIAMNNGRFLRLDDTVARFRLSGSSKTVGQTAAMAVEQYAVLERLLARDDLGEALGLSREQIQKQQRRARSVIALHAAHGYFKSRQWGDASQWLASALQSDPLAIFQRRWLDLALAGFMRRL
jgi:glycosyltransferase involved in cell wall biosynthesis